MNDLFNGVEDATDDSPDQSDEFTEEFRTHRTRATRLGRFALFRAHKVVILVLAGYGTLALGGIV